MKQNGQGGEAASIRSPATLLLRHPMGQAAAMLQSIITIPTDFLWVAVAFILVMAGMLAATPE
jgi:hypothetical protein